ncbi:MAG: hypothetical protein CMO80_04315 [Verrucomicrobiales bacterium]|nr:hypothetical protein [Verrucomicrobiales bacterium]
MDLLTRKSWPWLYGIASAASLGYETVWLKQLAQLFGASSHAVAVTLSVYILGFAVGGWLMCRLMVQAKGARRGFAGLQLFIGLWCALLPFLFQLADLIYIRFAPPEQTIAHQALRIVLAFALLLPPATAMGAVFPMVSAAGVGRMFAVGTFGSVAGVFLVALLVLPWLGLNTTLWLLAGINLLLAGISWFGKGEIESAVKKQAEPVEGIRKAAWIIGILGFSLFAAQGVWFKLIWLVVDATAYAEGMVIAAVLLAMTAGAVIGNRWEIRSERILLALAAVQLILIFAMQGIARVWTSLRPAAAGSFMVYCLCLLALALLIVGPAALGYGMAIPRFCRGFNPAQVGRLWCFHHIGCAVGMLLCGFVIIPLIGLTWTLVLSTLLLLTPLIRRSAQKWATAGAAVAVIVGFTGDVTYAKSAANPLKVVMHHEDGAGVVEVYEDENGYRRLMSSRLRQEGGDEPEQVRNELVQGKLPILLHPKPDNVLVIGMGTAISLRGALTDRVQKLTCVEISRGVVLGADLFAKANGNVLQEERVSLIEQDGRNFIKLTSDRYDLIVQELFFPYRAGVGALYTAEHFERAKAKLKPGGQFAQWISLSQIGTRQIRSLIRTFTEVFPETSGWLAGGYFMLIGGEQKLSLAPDNPALGHYFGSAMLKDWSKTADRNTEDNLAIEFSVPKAFRELNTTALAVTNLRQLLKAQDAVEQYHPTLVSAENAASRHVRQATLLRFDGHEADAFRRYEAAIQLDPNNFVARQALIADYAKRNNHRQLLNLQPDHLGARFNLGVELYRSGKYKEAAQNFNFVLNREPNNADAQFNLANSLAQLGKYPEAMRLYQSVLRIRPNHADAAANLRELQQIVD